MAENTKIEWADHTFNSWEGCTKVSPGCANCYAENRNARFGGGTAPNWGKGKPRRRTSAANWNKVRKWNREASDGHFVELFREEKRVARGSMAQLVKDGLVEDGDRVISVRPRVFCASLADWLDDEVPIEWLADLLDLIRECSSLDFLLLTKRPENWGVRLEEVLDLGDFDELVWDWLHGDAPSNVWIGTSVEDQKRAEERIPQLLSIPAKVRFLSCEPLLGEVKLDRWLWDSVGAGSPTEDLIHWVICGGESGPNARPMKPDWARSLRDQCEAAGVPFLFKQWGEWAPNWLNDDEGAPIAGSEWISKCGKKAAGRLLDGQEHTDFPEANGD